MAAILVPAYLSNPTDARGIEDKLRGETGISTLNVLERVIWGQNQELDPNKNPIDQLGSAWYLSHGPS